MKSISKIIFICLFTMASMNVMAQLKVGARAGANFANVSIDPSGDVNPNSIVGFLFAVPLEIEINENFSVQPELMFIQKGFNVEETVNFGGQTLTTKFDFIVNQIDLPVLALYNFVNSETLSVYAAAGPVFGYALSAKGKGEVNGQKDEMKFDWKEDIPDYNRFEILISVGAGAGVPAGPGQVVLDLRYLFGLTDLDGTEDSTQKNNGFQASIGYMIPIGQ